MDLKLERSKKMRKSNIIASFDYKIPEFMLCGIVNGDDSGLEKFEKMALRKVIQKFNKIAEEFNGNWTLTIQNYDKYFTYSPDFIKLGCEVFDCTLIII
jgi:hypothetical protein